MASPTAHLDHDAGSARGAGADTADTVIVGGGLIGVAVAWRSAQRGLDVAVVDPHPGSGTAQVAAGMIAPVSEVTYTEEPLLALGRDSAQRYPDFIAELEQATGRDTGYRTEGTLQVAFDTDDLAVLDELRRFQVSLGAATERLTSRECRKLEPMLAPAVRGGILAPDDHSVDPRLLEATLLTGARAAGAAVVTGTVNEVLTKDAGVAGVRLDSGREIRASRVVLAAGCWSGQLAGISDDAVPPVRPVKGQVLRLWTPQPFISRNVRGLVRGSPMYAVPRAGGEIVLGATSEDLGHDTRVTAGGVWELLRDGRDVLPGITELELTETGVGLRPGSPDNAPLLGATSMPGLYLSTGHYRGGVLLAPVTADAMAELLATGRMPEVARAFGPERFGTHGREPQEAAYAGAGK